jgi:hypothetical protein
MYKVFFANAAFSASFYHQLELRNSKSEEGIKAKGENRFPSVVT